MQIVSPSEQVKAFGLAHTAAAVAKTPQLVGGKVLIPLNTTDADERNAFVYESLVTEAPKAAGQAWTANQAIYWDDTNKVLTNVATANTLCAHALEPVDSAATESGLIAFDSFTAA